MKGHKRHKTDKSIFIFVETKKEAADKQISVDTQVLQELLKKKKDTVMINNREIRKMVPQGIIKQQAPKELTTVGREKKPVEKFTN